MNVKERVKELVVTFTDIVTKINERFVLANSMLRVRLEREISSDSDEDGVIYISSTYKLYLIDSLINGETTWLNFQPIVNEIIGKVFEEAGFITDKVNYNNSGSIFWYYHRERWHGIIKK